MATSENKFMAPLNKEHAYGPLKLIFMGVEAKMEFQVDGVSRLMGISGFSCGFKQRRLQHMGSRQNYGPFWGTLNNRCRLIIGTQKGP